ncbi:hypothetical protein M0805_006851 [Coniferiporia weirii]|nr:hypothetical protein M0805_006851 [Coniferiporia weirii]
MSGYALTSSKLDLKPKRHHGYSVLLFILGTLFPPLAVAARFGIGSDFWLNLLLTICGYIPGHVHNFYIQNVRNNKNNRRTPKWAQRYGLIDTTKIERNKKRSEWASRYNDRLPQSTLDGQEYEQGQVAPRGDRPDSILGPEQRTGNGQGQFWSEEEERYYGRGNNGTAGRSTGSLDSGSSTRWRYPANFEDSLPSADPAMELDGGKKKKKKGKKDRWARTEDAYSLPDGERPRKRRTKRGKGRSAVGGAEGDEFDRRSSNTSVEEPGFPEDPEGGLYSERRNAGALPEVPPLSGGQQRDELDHEF